MQRIVGMIRRSPAYVQNLTLLCVTILLSIIVCEVIIFRFVFLPTDVPIEAYVDGVVRYEPFQKGVFRWRDEITAPFAINDQGWNSGLDHYGSVRVHDVGRIAIIGDSYVNAFQVPFNASFAELTQEALILAGCPVEAFRFAIDGAPLSQYLHMLREEVIAYRPDLVVILLIHNDFDESFLFQPGRYTSSFLKLKLENGTVTDEIQPQPFHASKFDLLRLSATFRYLYYRQRVGLQPLRDLLFGVEPEKYDANIDVQKAMELLRQIRVVTDYVLSQVANLAKQHDFDVVVLMDGHREAIYGQAEEDREYGPLALNAVVDEVARYYDLTLIDLHDVFRNDWKMNRQRFEYDTNWHWNEAAHKLVADVLVDFLTSSRSALGCWK
jgi:GDSL-like Lipase/Acylhydrolase family